MRVSLVTNFCPFYRVKLFKLLAEQNQVKFVFTSAANESNWENLNPTGIDSVDVVSLQPKAKNSLLVIFALIKVLCSRNLDVVVQGLTGFLIVPISFMVAKLRGKPFILWTGLWHHPSTPKHKLTFPILKYVYNHSDAIIVYGSHVRDYLLKLGVSPSKIFMGWNTADNQQYNLEISPAERQKLRAKLNLPNDKKLLLFVGRLDKSKGVDVLLQALTKCEQMPALMIIGRGDETDQLKAFCQQNNLEDVHFLGYIPNNELYKYYNLADAVIVPSITTKLFKEPWGLIVNEAMNQGTVVIASDAVGAAVGGLIQNQKNGVVVPENNADELCQAIDALTPEKIETIGAAAKQTIQSWDYERMAKGFNDAINFVATTKKS